MVVITVNQMAGLAGRVIHRHGLMAGDSVVTVQFKSPGIRKTPNVSLPFGLALIAHSLLLLGYLLSQQAILPTVL